MTSICPGGGASEAKPGFSDVVAVGPTVITALLSRAPLPWAVALAGYIALYTVDLSSFCTNDPPADPGLTAADALALLTLNPVAAPIAERRFRDLIGRYLWHDLCQCVGGGTPDPPAPPSKPDGWPDVNPPALPGPLSNCGNGGAYGLNPLQWATSGTFHQDIATLVPGAQTIVLTFESGINFGAGWDIPFTFKFIATAGSSTPIGATPTYTIARTGSTVVTLPIPDGANFLRGEWTGPGGTTAIDLVSWSSQLLCAQGVGGAGGCCPPDPALQAQVDQILQLVTLIQRQLAPFAYITSTVHGGLTGQGNFDIQGLLGVKVAFTAIPDSLGRVLSVPTEIFDLGFVTFGTIDGYPQSVRLEHSPQVILPARCSAFTNLSYSLHSGVTAAITELVREP